jgi:S-adenosyl-L-methionine hydrolase (adenosine-forming)
VKHVITLLTDFGVTDYYVGAVKGVIVTLNPQVPIIDITHDVPPQDIHSAAFTLLACYRDFPPGTIHVAVVDPGVGSTRRAIVVSAAGQYFVGPDNGIFSYVVEREPSHRTYHVLAEKYFRRPTSTTFHGRDVFAPVAAALSQGISPTRLGIPIIDEVRLEPLAPQVQTNWRVKGRIIHIDRFGNCVTNFTRDAKPVKLIVKRRVIKTFRQFFAEDDGSKEQIFAIWGSAGFLELASNRRSAAELLHVKRGDSVTLIREPGITEP